MRKSGSQKACKDARDLLDQGMTLTRELADNILVVTYLVKDFIRNVPGSLMVDALEDEWLKLAAMTDFNEKVHHAKR
jgi:hypothetical protein